ncbi:MAG: STAS domain-containing protein [Acidobacteria bacterium]|nr:STAS domain-containing protein [Acidobacteriota bacterium]
MSSTPQSLFTIDRSTSEQGIPTLMCRGRLTSEAGDFITSEVKDLSPSHKFVFADFSGVGFVDSSGLGALLRAYISAKKDGCELKLVNVHPRVRDLLDLTRLTGVLQ